MKTRLNTTERFHFMDALRASLLLLGLVIHSASTYTDADFGIAWVIHDSNTTHLFMDGLVAFINNFWLPIFFIMAGFWGSHLFYDYTPMKMIKNRFNRIFLPFVIFLLCLWPLINFGFSFSNEVFLGTPNPFESTLALINDFSFFIPTHTFHLWFLYYLFLFSITAFVLGLFFNKLPLVTIEINDWFRQVLEQSILKVVFFSCITFLMLLNMDQASIVISTSFLPDPNTFVFYFYFYLFGWLLFRSKQWLVSFKKYDLYFTLLGVFLFNVHFFGQDQLPKEAVIAIHSFCIWLFCFGLIGLFFRWVNKESSVMRYLSDASYWVYLFHLVVITFLTGWMGDWVFPAFAKFLITLTITTCISFVSYHYLVRATFIGQFLNGRKYSRRVPYLETLSVPVRLPQAAGIAQSADLIGGSDRPADQTDGSAKVKPL